MENINVTKPFLPPLEDYLPYIQDIWKRSWLTNDGPLVKELETKLKAYLGLDHFLFVTNGTIAIQMAIKALGIRGKIITTPFSYVATTSSIVWEGCEPVYVDIDPKTFNIDPSRIEAALSGDVKAILATHVFGNPCDIPRIKELADKHGLKVIYDAAHGFGSRYLGKSLYEYGDISTASFHATKLFHTVEGGGVFTSDPEILKKLSFIRNFGHDGPGKFAMLGINGKNSEVHAAMGLANLKYVDEIIRRRQELSEYYDLRLNGLKAERQQMQLNTDYNFAYYPVLLPTEAVTLRMIDQLVLNNIYPRRYFYPSLTKLPYVQGALTPVSDDIASRILCLPFYHTLTEKEVDKIAQFLLKAQDSL